MILQALYLPAYLVLCSAAALAFVPALPQHLLPEQCLLDEPQHYNALLQYIPDEELRSSLAAKWAKGEVAGCALV